MAGLAEVNAAGDKLAEIKGELADDPRLKLMGALLPSAVAATVALAGISELDQILAALVGGALPEEVRSTLAGLRPDLLGGELGAVVSLLGTVNILDRNIGQKWAEAAGQDELLGRIRQEIPWAGEVVLRQEDDGLTVSCDYWYVAPSRQPTPHDDVVRICEMLISICPSADIAVSRAVSSNGEVAGFSEYPVATKRIPRTNLPPAALPAWNRRWQGMIARRVALPSYSEYLVRGVHILDRLVPKLERFFDIHLRGRNPPLKLYEALNNLNQEAMDLTPPINSVRAATGEGSGEVSYFSTPFQDVLFGSTVNMIKRFANLPEGAGSYIAWLNDLLANIEKVIKEEPWQLIGEDVPPNLIRLQGVLETLRMLAGEAHMRNAAPVVTWAKSGKRARLGNALRSINMVANGAEDARANKIRAELETSARQAGIRVQFHLRRDARGILPWPPLEVFALLPADTIAMAAIEVEASSATIRSLIDSTVSVTIVPVVCGFSVGRFARTGYQTLLPLDEIPDQWLEELGISPLPAPRAEALGMAVESAMQLEAIDRNGFGGENRPISEFIGRQELETVCDENTRKLLELLEGDIPDTMGIASTVLTEVRDGCIDLSGVEKAVLGGEASPGFAEVGALMMNVLEIDLADAMTDL